VKKLLSGRFANCYGIKAFDLQEIDFSKCNKAIIYAPNGVMKSSFAKVFEDIARGKPSEDRIFKNVATSYTIDHYTNQFTYDSTNPTDALKATEKIYVINSFINEFEFTSETVSTLLADVETRATYNAIVDKFSTDIRQIEESFRQLTGLTKPQIKERLIKDLQLSSVSDWPDIFEKLNELMPGYIGLACLDDVKYSELFNEKVLPIYQKHEFKDSIEAYIEKLGDLLSNSDVLTETFTDRSAEALGKSFAGNNLFEANHKVQLKDGTTINSLSEWNSLVKKQLERLHQDPELSKAFSELKKMLTANNDVSRVRDIIVSHREIIPYLKDISPLKIQVWLSCATRLDNPFESYFSKVSEYTEQIRGLYEKAAKQSERWQEVVSEFNRRFRVPFEIQIDNKASVLLKDEAPSVTFIYSRGTETTLQKETLIKNDLMKSLSMGEKRALYLLYILFDLERIRQYASSGTEKFLIVADDIADSFDYKNKYAIIEYLNDLAQNVNIDLLMLTHNFDFCRTVLSRLNIARNNCYIAQRNLDGIVSMTVLRYQKNFFKNVIIDNIKTGYFPTDEAKIRLLSSIPFYRNLSEYSDSDDVFKKLTCFLHWKTAPINTCTTKLSDLWEVIRPYLSTSGSTPFQEPDGEYMTVLKHLADSIATEEIDEVSLENKLIVSIAVRLLAEVFLQKKITENGKICADSSKNQTRDWFDLAKEFLSADEQEVIESVLLITPENIHLNAFMYEPLIDISDWTLNELYRKVVKL